MIKTSEDLEDPTRSPSSTSLVKEREPACYDLKCKICDYEWRTRYARIPAQCSACRSSMYGTKNYMIQREVYYTDRPISGTKEYSQEVGYLIGAIFLIFISIFFLGYGLLVTLGIAGIGLIVALQKARKLGFI